MDIHELWFPPGATRHDWVIDGAMAIALLLVAVPVYLIGFGQAYNFSYLIANALMLVPLIVRRHSPMLMLAGVSVAAIVHLFLLDAPSPGLVAIPIAAYTVARWIPGRWSRLAIVAGGIGSVIGPMRWVLGMSRYVSVQQLVSLGLAFMVCIGLVVTPYAIGRRAREAGVAQEHQAAQADERYRALMIEREQQARIAESKARTQIARELHDIVAHSLSVMIVQAEGGRAASVKRPAAATEALTTIAETGREALTEMRRILGVLRSEPDDDAVEFAPAPRLEDIPELVARTSDRAQLSVNGQLPRVSQVMGLTVYRVVQEALTNFLKHAGPTATVRVTLTYGARSITVDVLDDGVGEAQPAHQPGHGLRGMNERVVAMGGKLVARPHPRGGFQVTAVLPLTGVLAKTPDSDASSADASSADTNSVDSADSSQPHDQGT